MLALVVEDSPAMRQLVVYALSRLKTIQVVEASDGLEALKLLAQHRFDLVITDINMPILDGLKLTKRIRSDPTMQRVPIVIITTESADEERARAMALGADAYIAKPIQAQQVIATVQRLLALEGAGSK